ncbi:hypothetical protein ABNQ39_07115 [Azospirillum sp. A26]|uniref:hypothetical protein n=1 Tax=Azospirillum sp. A26 TaxID=3160607 RepID=UPI00366B0CDC
MSRSKATNATLPGQRKRERNAPPDPETLAIRGQHKAIEHAGSAILRPSHDRSVVDADGGVGSPYRVVDILHALARKEEIQVWHVEAGEHFQTSFGIAHLDPLKAADLSRGGGGALRDQPAKVYRAREDVAAAVRALGGMGSPAANAIWDILGQGLTVKEHAERTIFGTGRSLNPTAAKGILVGALGVLAWHYGYDPESRKHRMGRVGERPEFSLTDADVWGAVEARAAASGKPTTGT